MYEIDLFHLGDNCAPGIIIDDILHIKKKCLFMLGNFDFNDIENYLRNCGSFEKIYDKDNLKIHPNEQIVLHSLFNFGFNHDYTIENGVITNYENIKKRFDIKIKNLLGSLFSIPNKTVFINFTRNVDNLKIKTMLHWFKRFKNNIHLLIFTNNGFSIPQNSENVSIIKLDRSYEGWWDKPNDIKTALYREIYEKFIWSLNENNISHDFPANFNETYYGKSH